MKNIILFCLLLIFGCSSAPVISEKLTVVDLPGQTKQQIYQKSLQWVTYTFVSGKAVIDYKDPDMGRIIGKGNQRLGNIMMNEYFVKEIVTIDCVNGRARITINPATCSGGNSRVFTECPCSSYYIGGFADIIPEKIYKLIQDYSTYMQKGKSAAWDGK